MNFRSLVFLALVSRATGVEPPVPPTPDKQPEPPFAPSQGGAPQMLVPGFQVRELPIAITSLNNVEYAADGRLFAGGYDGRFHLLRDTDGDGLEDQAVTFSPEESSRYPLGMVVKDGVPHAVLTDEVVRFIDADNDGVPDKRETVVKGFDDPELANLPYLNYRRVDSSLALALGPDGAIYVTMGNAGYSNPYWHDGALPEGGKAAGTVGTAHYSTDKRRGCLLRITPAGKVEQLASGLRYIMGLQFNRFGDLFGTDQEGATWSPNGNPFDELLHLQAGRHYGFPPRHPQFLPDVIDEPSVWDYAPQHQSTCGFRFNGPWPRRGRFGPEFWSDDAIVTGESRGRLWRTKLAKTAAGYVARTDLFARMGLLPVDCTISPQGDLLVSCHTGKPDWGNGPKGAGRLFKISLVDKTIPQPVLAWAAGESETILAFDRPLDAAKWRDLAAQTTMISGRFIGAAERLEKIRPGYAVVQMQQREKPVALAVKSAQLSEDRRSIRFETAPRASAVNYALTIGQPGINAIDVMHDLGGVAVEWTPGNSGRRPTSGDLVARWLPHPDFAAAREFTRGSAPHDELWKQINHPGSLTLRGNLDLWKMLIPVTQPGSDLGYTPELEVVTVVVKSDSAIRVYAPGVKVEQEGAGEARITVTPTGEGRYQPFSATIATPSKTLEVSYHTNRDPRPRALGTRRFLVPFAKAVHSDAKQGALPEIAGGNWEAGRELFKGKAMCATCHQLRGDGVQVGPDLGNLVHRDYASVLIDIADPNAAINPDAAGYSVT
ncbi:MAG TPA: c-type cytochrome, partial [Chthoniobacteraceae bacterium]|nr:c-type cytochrome [Chthoniobacteraceae bacterium]